MSDQNQYWDPNQPQGGQYPPAEQPSANDPYATIARGNLPDAQMPAAAQPPASDPYAAQPPVYDPNQLSQQGYGQAQYQQGYDPYAGQAQYQQGYDPYAGQAQYQQQAQPAFDTSAVAKQGSSFFKDLFDLSFNKFVTPRIVTAIYVLSMVAIAIGVLAWVVTPFLARQPMAGLITLFVAPLVGLLWVAFIRVKLESMVALIRTAENTRDLNSKVIAEGEINTPPMS